MFPEEYARILLSLKDKIREWRLTTGGIALEPVNANFDLLVVGRQALGFSSDYKWVFTAPIVIDWPEEKLVEAYRRIKMMECEAEAKGVIRRTYLLVESSIKRSIFHGLPFDDRLAKSLQEAGLINLIKEASPDEFIISAYYELKPEKSFVECMLEAYMKPPKLGWLVTATKGPIAEIIFPRVARRMFKLLDETAFQLRRLTPRLLEA